MKKIRLHPAGSFFKNIIPICCSRDYSQMSAEMFFLLNWFFSLFIFQALSSSGFFC